MLKVAVLCALVVLAAARQYADNKEVLLFVNKVGPYHNPQEVYAYTSLPLCGSIHQGEHEDYINDGLGSMLIGNELRHAAFAVHFKKQIDNERICLLELDPASADKLAYAVEFHYWYQMYLDDLPLWGMLGDMLPVKPNDDEVAHIYAHKSLTISHNGNHVIEVNLVTENPVPIVSGKSIEMTYSIKWVETDIEYENRFDRYLDFNFFEHQIHWFSVFNSFMMVIFLCGLVSLILMRTLKNDYARYAEDDDMDLERVVDESGWKQVHADVFRAPPHFSLFCALVGTGVQLTMLIIAVLLISITATLYSSRGTLVTACIITYALTGFIAGYVSSSFYKNLGGKDWKFTMILTHTILPCVCFLIGSLLNSIAIAYQSSASIPFGTIVGVLVIWLFVGGPLVVLGTLLGRRLTTKGDYPCRINKLRRPIPDSPWYMQPLVVGLLGGILPFASIFIEMYFVFTSFWNYKFYYVYGFMLLVFIILAIVTMCVTIVSTYFLLNAEDYRWHWTSFLGGGSTGIYVFVYAIYYFLTRTEMSGFFQTSFYFGYMGMFCVTLFTLCGAIGVWGTNVFVRNIYSNIKSD